MDKDFVKKRMIEYVENAGRSKSEVSLKMGHAHSYLSSVAKGHFTPSLEEIFYFCTLFHITPSEFFREEPLTVDQQLLCSKVASLSPPQVKLLLDLIDQFKK